MKRRPPRPTLLPYPTLFRSRCAVINRMEMGTSTIIAVHALKSRVMRDVQPGEPGDALVFHNRSWHRLGEDRSEEHTSELQSRQYLVCRLLLEKKKMLLSTPI